MVHRAHDAAAKLPLLAKADIDAKAEHVRSWG